MKTEKNILLAFILNLSFSVLEVVGGLFTGSVAILSDAVHDIGDALSIGISYFLEKKSKKQPDEKYTYGYARYSVIGGVITTTILLFGSVMVIYNAIKHIIDPIQINYNGMIIFAMIGVLINFFAAYFTREGDSLNQKAVNLHMLEDVLSWVVVLVGAIFMKFTDISLIDPIMSICIAIFILVSAVKNMQSAMDLFLVKTPDHIDMHEISEHIMTIDGVIDVHHIHIWSLDGEKNYATMHIVTNYDFYEIKKKIREELKEHGISHATLELEDPDEQCQEKQCSVDATSSTHGHHHHHRRLS